MTAEGLIAGVLGIPALWGALYYVKLWRTLPPVASPSRLGRSDAMVAGVLAFWFLSLIIEGSGEVQQVSEGAILSSMVIYGGIVVLLGIFLVLRGISPIAEFGLGNPMGREARFLVVCFLALVPAITLTQWGAAQVFPQREASQPIMEFWMQNPDWQQRGLVALMAIIVAPVAEETIFRGYLFGVARQFVGRAWAMVACALLFAGIHGHLPSFPGLFLLAIMLTLIYERTRSLWAPILTHAAFNGLSLSISLLWPRLTV